MQSRFQSWHELRDLIAQRSLIKNQNFKLSSGLDSNYFFNMKMTMLNPQGINWITDAILDILEGLQFSSVGGMAVGSVPITSSITTKSLFRNKYYPSFFVRKEIKDHGFQTKIDGYCDPNTKVVLIEDVTTTGESILHAVNAVEQIGCTVDTVITVVDRLEGASLNLSSRGINLIPLYIKTDFEHA